MAIVITMAETLVALAQPWPMKFVVDNALGGRPLPRFLQPLSTLSVNALAGVAAGVLVVLIAAGALLGYLSTYLSGAASERIGADLRAAVHERLLLLPVRFHDEHRSGELVSRLVSDVDRVQDALVVSLMTTLPGILTFVGVIVLMFTIDPVLSVAALVILPILGAVVVARRNGIRRAQRRAREEEGRLAALATDVVRNVRAVQAFNHEPVAQARFERQNVAAARASIFALDLEARYSPLADIVLAIGSAAVLWFGVTRVTSGRITLGVLLVFLAYLASLYAPIRSFARLARTMAKASASRERIVHVLSDSEVAPEDPEPVTAEPPVSGLRLRDVDFSYCSDAPVLRNVSLEIPAGESVCLVGPSGVGKSTLLALLLRFYDPGSGSIELDGVDFRRFSLSSLRRQFALVPQEAWILDGTIAENIAFARPDATMADVKRAASVALVDEFVHRLPKSYDTIVGESGSLLSGGQRRRIALARAVVRDAPVLLLDEPTSGLDPTSEDAVIEAIRNAARGKTLLVASHRLSVAAITDRVVVFDDGQVMEDGTPAALLDRDGEFARLWSLQHRDHLRDDAAGVSLSSTPTRR